jgi:hypothetical protein
MHMSGYSPDLREKFVESVKKGVTKAETVRRFGVDRATVKRYCKQLDERGTLAEEGSRQETEAGREGDEAAPGRPPTEAVGYPLTGGRVPVGGVGGEGERSVGLSGSKALQQEPKKDPQGQQNGTSS